jgi:hypothetical protein
VEKPGAKVDPASCPHRFKDLRICEHYPTRYYECSACEAMFWQQVVMALDFPGSTDRLKALIWALAGLSTDERPLAQVLAPGLTLKEAWPLWPNGRIHVVEGGRDDDEETSSPAWNRRAS